jgi:nickel/cobalt exporter
MDRRLLVLLPLTLVIIFCLGFRASAENPFMSTESVEETKKELHYPAFIQRFIQKIGALQRRLNKRMTELGHDLKTGENLRPLIVLISIAFVYGIVHALGPGHGKTVAGSYFLSKKAAVGNGILLGFLIAVVHAVSAVTVVLVLYFILKRGIGASLEHYSRVVKLISAIAIMMIGIFLLVRRIFGKRKRQTGGVEHKHRQTRSIFLIAFAVGIVPCPGAVLILLFSMNLDIIVYGIVLAFVMSLGMALTISVACCAVIVAKRGIVRAVAARSGDAEGKAGAIGLSAIEIFGAIIVIALGAFLLVGTV